MRDILRRALRWFSAAAAPLPVEVSLLKIHDLKYGITVDLDDGINAAIARGGWNQAAPEQLPGGAWADVVEDIRIALLNESNLVYSTLGHMARRAQELQSPLHPDYLNPATHIVLEARTPDELSSRWAVLSNIVIDKLDAAHYRQHGRTYVKLEVTREGLWRDASPSITASQLRAYSLISPGVKIAIDNDALDVRGDAPSPLHLDIRTYFDCWLAISADVVTSDFTPFLWALDLAGISIPADLTTISTMAAPYDSIAAMPVDSCYQVALGAGSFRSAHWSLDLSDYYGYFTAYAVVAASAACTMRFYHQYGGDEGTPMYGEEVQVAASTANWRIVRLGTFRIPFAGDPIGGVFPATTYYAGVDLTASSGTAYLAGLLLVPETETPQTVPCYGTNLGNPITRSSGVLQRVYWTSSVGVPILTPGDVAYGPFQELDPAAGLTNNLWLIPVTNPSDPDAPAYFPPGDVDWRVGVYYQPRWRFLSRTGL